MFLLILLIFTNPSMANEDQYENDQSYEHLLQSQRMGEWKQELEANISHDETSDQYTQYEESTEESEQDAQNPWD